MNLPLSEVMSKPTVINDTQFNMVSMLQNVSMLESNNQQTAYHLGSNDVIAVNVWGHPEFNTASATPLPYGTTPKNASLQSLQNSFGVYNQASNGQVQSGSEYVLDNDGSLFFPLVGKVVLAGLTVQQAQSLLSNKISKYIVNPQVTLKIANFRSQRVLVMGEVNTPQLLALSDVPLTLAGAIGLSGGINSTTANVEQIYVLRPSGRHSVTAYWVDMSSASAMVYAQFFNLKANDVIYVSTAGLAQFNRVMNQLLPTAEVLWYTKTAFPNSAGILIN